MLLLLLVTLEASPNALTSVFLAALKRPDLRYAKASVFKSSDFK